MLRIDLIILLVSTSALYPVIKLSVSVSKIVRNGKERLIRTDNTRYSIHARSVSTIVD